MTYYEVKAKVDQIVTREFELLVAANGGEEEVESLVREALSAYPKGVPNGKKLPRIEVVDSNYWIPRDIDIVSIEEREDDDGSDRPKRA